MEWQHPARTSIGGNNLLSQFNAQNPYSDLYKTDIKVKQYLGYYQILQNAQEIATIINNAEGDSLDDNLDKIYNSTDPMLVAYRYEKSNGEKSGHAVTPFAVEQVSDTEFVVWIYDNNYVNDYEEITINLADSSWSYPFGTEKEFAVIEPPRPKAEGEYYTAPWDYAAASTTISSIGESSY